MIKKSVQVINDFSGGQDTRTPIITMPLTKSPNMRNYHCAGVGNRLMKRLGREKVNSSAVEIDGLDVAYPPGYQTTDYAVRDAAARTEISQGFKCATTDDVTKVRVWLKKTGSPTGNINVEIQTDSSGVPSKSAVSNGTSANVDISTLTTSYAWYTFTFSTNPSLTAGTQYHLVLQGSNTVNGTAYAQWGVDNYDVVYPDGSMSVYDASTWTTEAVFDAVFEIYITGGNIGNVGVATFDFSSKNMYLGVFGTFLYKMDKSAAGTPDGTWDTVPGGSAWNSNTKVISNFDGSDAAVAFTDPVAGAWTFVGTAQLDTAQKKFGTASLLLDGNSDYITLVDSDDWTFNADFTIDFWVRFNDKTGAQAFCGQSVDGSNVWVFRKDADDKLTFFHLFGGSYEGQFTTTAAPSISNDTWYHIAFVRSSNTAYMFFDGTSQAITIIDAFTGALTDVGAATLQVGASAGASLVNGWIDELRISKGIARWTANFTAPTAAYAADSLPLTSSRFWTFADWQSGRALVNTDIGLYTYTGTGNVSVVSGAPIGKFMTIWRNYVFMCGVRGSANTVRHSDLSDYTTWTASQTLNFDTNDGDVITGVRILKNRLYIFKRYSVHRVSYLGSNPTFQVDPILNIGCPSHYCIKEVDLGGDLGTVLIFPTTDKRLAIFDGYNSQIVNDTLTEETNDLFATADNQPISFSDMDYTYADLFHASVKKETYEYIMWVVLSGDTTVNYGFVFDFKTGGVYPYDGQAFSSSMYALSTSKSKKLYATGYTGYMWELDTGNDDDGSDINAYWVSGKMKSDSIALINRRLLLGVNCKEETSATTVNVNFQYRLDWNVSWTTADTFNFDHNDELAFGKTALFDIGSISNMFQVKLQDNSSNPSSTIYSLELFGEPLGISTSDRSTA